MKRIRGGKLSVKQKLEIEWKRHNKDMREIQCHHLQKSYDEFVAYKYGYSTAKQRTLPAEEKLYRRPEENVPSLNSSFNVCVKKENKQYTGTLITGVATMHKSNAVPVINSQQAKDLAEMRR